MGIYDGTYQLTIRDPRDIQFNNHALALNRLPKMPLLPN
jgi:hypothetical protein